MTSNGTAYVNEQNLATTAAFGAFLREEYGSIEILRQTLIDELRDESGNLSSDANQFAYSDDATSFLTKLLNASSDNAPETMIVSPLGFGAYSLDFAAKNLKPSDVAKNSAALSELVNGSNVADVRTVIADGAKADLFLDMSKSVGSYANKLSFGFSAWQISGAENPGMETVKVSAGTIAGNLASGLVLLVAGATTSFAGVVAGPPAVAAVGAVALAVNVLSQIAVQAGWDDIVNSNDTVGNLAQSASNKLNNFYSELPFDFEASDSALGKIGDMFSDATGWVRGKFSLASTDSLTSAFGKTIGQLFSMSGNEHYQQSLINMPDGTERLVYQDSMVFVDSISSSGFGNFKIFDGINGLLTFNSATNHITTNPNNQWMDNHTDFKQVAGDHSTSHTSVAFQNGVAADGGNYQITMTSSILNGNGFQNVSAASIAANDYRSGAGTLASSNVFIKDMSSIVTNLINGTLSLSPDFLSGGNSGLPKGGYYSSFLQQAANMMKSSVFLKNVDPVVLDLDGDGIELIAYKDSIATFDVDNDNYIENTGWVGADDGILVLLKTLGKMGTPWAFRGTPANASVPLC